MPSDSSALEKASSLGKGFEGFSPSPYLDPAKVWTIGYGSTRDKNGNPVTFKTPWITRAEGLQLLERDMRAALQTVKDNVTVPLDTDEEAALTDFVYNLGAGNFMRSTLLRLLNAGDYAGAADQLSRWDLANGQVLAGLVRRRAAEKALFDQGIAEQQA